VENGARPANYRPHPHPDAQCIEAAHAGEVHELFADAVVAGESPDFYSPEMLDDGTYFGVREGGCLVSIAGTHLISRQEGVAAVGCVYTRRDHRGRCLAARVTTAVINELLNWGIPTIGLNVHEQNFKAISLYERLGFVKYCDFCEGLARSRAAKPVTGRRP
jgi:GNAT superfamily N-acetyltransferase